jgi:hypothetical protein
MNPVALIDALAREGVIFASLAGIVLLGAILVFVLRARILPVCWNCGHPSIRRSLKKILLAADGVTFSLHSLEVR